LYLHRFHDDTVAQTSYLIGCESTGLAIVVDPNRDTEQYLRAAERRHLTIAFVAETHIHADFVSGARDLARQSGGTLVLSGEGGADWQYAFAAADGARVVHDGDRVDVGEIRVDVRHTPGHTPEHICFIVTDRATNEHPIGMSSGDFIFVGDVGRPDLLERVGNANGSMDRLARSLYASIRATQSLPDYLQIWPGHGAGSACGKSLGALPSTTLGYERFANWAFQIHDEDAFVRAVLEGQPEVPKYFAVMKRVNRDGPAPAPDTAQLPELDLVALQRATATGAVMVDVRPAARFAIAHLPGSINIPLGGSFARWAGSLLPYDSPLVLQADDHGQLSRAAQAMALIGLDRIAGWCGDAVRREWTQHVGPLGTMKHVDVTTLAANPNLTVLDVRATSEWNDGHLPQATHGFLGDLVAVTADLAPDTPIAVHCQGGGRSAIAASLLQARGFTNVSNVTGGYRAWEASGLPVVRPDDRKN
jgi:hydroxyacylglutathione hydrolase